MASASVSSFDDADNLAAGTCRMFNSFASSEASVAADRPQLIIEYE